MSTIARPVLVRLVRLVRLAPKWMIAVVASTTLASAQLAPAPPIEEKHNTAPFRVLDNVEGPWVSVNVVPVRPMISTEHGLYAVNTHASTVVKFDGTRGIPSATFHVPWAPVSIARWSTVNTDELLVVCGGSHVLARLDRVSGEIVKLLKLPFEPADIVVDAVTGRAFISCSGADSVVEVDLASNTIAHEYPIPGKHPLFLSFDAEDRVLVAPQFSGNNSGTIGEPGVLQSSAGLSVIDFETNPLVVSGLPDEDIFRIDPALGTVQAVAKDVGTVLFAQGTNPVTGAFWQLNTEANNKDPLKQSEPAVRGFAIDNRLTITTLPQDHGDPPVTSHTVINLDDADPGTGPIEYDPAKTVGQPYSLAFSSNGFALVTGLLTDNVTILDASGSAVLEWDLPAGSIPRAAILDATESVAFVYCWGTNKVETYLIAPVPAHTGTLHLGLDPAPKIVRDGRKVFYSAAHSLNNNASCASCHVEGRTDMVLWNLSNLPEDDKGPLVTQTLAGIQKLAPFHWRGERPGLLDFNPAFDGLLGGTPLSELPGGEFEKFQAFVFSIQNPANPNEDPRRVVSDAAGSKLPASSTVAKPSAVNGQNAYFEGSLGNASCNRCHTLPTGTSGDIVADGAVDPIPKRANIKITPYNEMWRKEQLGASVTFFDSGTISYPLLGAGVSHAGLADSIFDFIDLFPIPDQEAADIFSFVSQIDQGLSPMVHRAVHLSPATLPGSANELTVLYARQARKRNCDLALFGKVDLGAGEVTLRWAFDRVTDLFVPEDSSVAPRPLAFFIAAAQAGAADVVVVGLPVGMARSFAIDFDQDDVLNLDEPMHATSSTAFDSDGDTFGDGYELANDGDPTDPEVLPQDGTAPVVSNLRLGWTTAKHARLYWDTDEPARFEITCTAPGLPTVLARDSVLESVHAEVITGLQPSSGTAGSSTYGGTLKVTNASGLSTTVALPAIQTKDFFFRASPSGAPEGRLQVVVGNLAWTLLDTSERETLHARAEARIDHKVLVPGAQQARDQVVIATVLVNNVRASDFRSPLPTSFTIFGAMPLFPGPFVMSPVSGTDGLATLEFTLSGLAPGDVVTLNIEAVAIVDPLIYDPRAPDFGDVQNQLPLSLYSFPDTPAANRKLTTGY